MMKTILFVCTGNVCRSPMAEGIFRRAVEGRGEYQVLSAGLGAACSTGSSCGVEPFTGKVATPKLAVTFLS